MIPCETCEGAGDVVLGWTPHTWTSPGEAITDECPVCLGHGEVKAWELEAWGDVFPLAEEVVRLMHERHAAGRDGDG